MQKLFVLFVLAALAALPIRVPGQSGLWGSRDAYLGQKPVADTPQIFAPGLLALKDTFALDRVAFSDDGREFYYPTNNTWFSSVNAKIRYFRFESGRWRGPFVLVPHYYAPTFSMDGQTLIVEGGERDTLHWTIYRMDRKADGEWTGPVPYLREPYGLYMFMPTASGVCYAGSNGHQGKLRDFSTYDICRLRMAGGDTTIESLGPPINTPGFEGDFYVARDESYIILSAKETPTYECELDISFHRPDGSWTAPVGLGPLINDGVAHRWGEYVSPDGRYLFYSRGTSPKDCHVYWVRWDGLLERLRAQVLGGSSSDWTGV
jgi:hypothetical protein